MGVLSGSGLAHAISLATRRDMLFLREIFNVKTIPP